MTKIIESNNINKKTLIKRIKSGEILIYPADNSYNIGCSALKNSSISKLRKIISNNQETLTIIPPNKKWIYDTFDIKNKNFIKKLPGPFTFKLKLKKRQFAKNINLNQNKIKIKMPNNKFLNLIKSSKIPIVSESIPNKKPVTSINNIPKKIIKKVDIIINYGEIKKSPITKLDLTKDIPSIL